MFCKPFCLVPSPTNIQIAIHPSLGLTSTTTKRPLPGWCLPHQKCNAGDCCAWGTSCNTCPFGSQTSNRVCAGKGNHQCLWKRPLHPLPGWCLPHQKCKAGDCCSWGTSCNTCPFGSMTSNNVCAGKGNHQCMWS